MPLNTVLRFVLALQVLAVLGNLIRLVFGWHTDSAETILAVIVFHLVVIAVIIGPVLLLNRQVRLRLSRLGARFPGEIALTVSTDSMSVTTVEKYSTEGKFPGDFTVTLLSTPKGIEFWAGGKPYLAASVPWSAVIDVRRATYPSDFELGFDDDDSAVFEVHGRNQRLGGRDHERVDRVVAGILERRNIHSPQSA